MFASTKLKSCAWKGFHCSDISNISLLKVLKKSNVKNKNTVHWRFKAVFNF